MSSVNNFQDEIRKNYLLGEENAGLKFMATQFNIKDKRTFLRTEKVITATEYFMLEEIECGTIGARNKKKTIDWTAEFYLQDFSGILKIGLNKVYVLLKSLHQKNLIVRYPTRSKGLERIGLNPEVFGQILCDTHELIVKRRKEREVLKQNKQKLATELNQSQNSTSLVPNQDQIEHKKTPLDSFRLIKTSLEGKEDKIEESLSLEERERDRIEAQKAKEQLAKLFPSVMKSMPLESVRPTRRYPVQMTFLV